MLNQQTILQTLKRHRIGIKECGVRKLALFGSYARGNAKKGSDIDFLVEFNKGRGLFDDYTRLRRILHTVLKREIDLVKPTLIREELREAIQRGKKIEAEL